MKNPYINLIIQSWRFAREKRMSFILAIGFFVIANCILLLQPYLFGQVLNALQIGGPNLWDNFVFYLVLYSIVPFFVWIFHGNGRIIERTAAFYIGKNFNEYVFSIVTKLPFAWHSDNHSGETINKVNKSANALEGFSDDNFEYIQTIVRFMGSLVGIAIISWYLSVLAFFSVVIIVSIVLFFNKKLVLQYEKIFEKENKVASLLHDYISNIRTVITLHFESLAKHELMSKVEAIFPIKRENFVLNELKWFFSNMSVSVVGFGIIFCYGYFTLKETGIILAGNLVILYQYLDKFADSFFRFASYYERIVKMNTELQMVDSIMEEHAKLREKGDVFGSDSWTSIQIENWNFSYGSLEEKHTLKNISMELKKGVRIAMIGESGSGKSTMASLIKGLYIADNGRLKIDGQDYNHLGILSKITTLIPQDPEIFENTLAYNVTFGIETTPEHIADAVRLARFDSVLKRLPNGLETNIKEKGVNLSGGEKQRLALARGLFMARSRDIIIMDEPTSSVDPINEIAIYKNIFEEYPEKCIISAVHKLHLLPMFDTIYFFDHGEIIESGSFDSLVARGGRFTELWGKYTESSKEGF